VGKDDMGRKRTNTECEQNKEGLLLVLFCIFARGFTHSKPAISNYPHHLKGRVYGYILHTANESSFLQLQKNALQLQ
jgi:hypothetical protein